MHQFLADTILVIHAVFIAFVVIGLFLILAGGLLRWAWVRSFWFRAGHLLAISIVVTEALVGCMCPLTEWEGSLRESAGGSGYSGSFIQHWLQKLIFYDFPPWVFTVAYAAFGVIVVLTWFIVQPRWPWAKTQENGK